MKTFSCAHCQALIYFENTVCVQCGHTLGFDAYQMQMQTMVMGANGVLHHYFDQANSYRYCSNAQYDACNWLVPANSMDDRCVSCALNHTIPSLGDQAHKMYWQKMERAKRRLVYSLLRLGILRVAERNPMPAFSFLSDEKAAEKIVTGHFNGMITIALEEADDAYRERLRVAMHEPHRTLLGHMRHESGHYYWNSLVANTDHIFSFRNQFGNEQIDYTQAINHYYQYGAPSNWQMQYVSAYASAHPWEDWAETWAHYLHMVDTLETGYSFGIDIMPQHARHASVQLSTDPYLIQDFDQLMESWLPLTYAMNSINRSMGLQDLYPFVLGDTVLQKLRYIHTLILPMRMQQI